MTAPATCLLCGTPASSLDKTFEVNQILGLWTNQLGIDVSGEFKGASHFHLHRCDSCTLRFFQPNSIAGSPALYEKLEKFDWYYIPNKWEHREALEDLSGCKNGVEVGCGFGDFVARAATDKQIAFEGCEQNASAVKVAQARGLQVHLETLQGLASSRPAGYSAVCSFQVLEHLSEPRDFLNAACSLLRSGGKLMLGLPNAESFLRHQYNILDMPPHHMTRWTAEVLTRIQRWFPLKLLRIVYEPLADYHVDGYVETYTGLLASKGLRFFAHPAFRSRTCGLIRKTGIQRLLRGQSIYACYVRT
jgi:2-polyprenyl-3-methyl-5-hydroxy-6-metoxy-1,4-benzoquinol methylase